MTSSPREQWTQWVCFVFRFLFFFIKMHGSQSHKAETFPNGILEFLSCKTQAHLLHFFIPSVFTGKRFRPFYLCIAMLHFHLYISAFGNLFKYSASFLSGTMPFIPFICPVESRIILVMKVTLQISLTDQKIIF